jgi:hypothetical protein
MHYAFDACADGYSMDDVVTEFPDRACPVEHWGYLFRGEGVEYSDGSEELLKAGTRCTSSPATGPT